MSFSSMQFVAVFLPVFLIIYYLSSDCGRRDVLLFGSLIFYTLGDYKSVPALILSLIINFGFNKLLLAEHEKRNKRSKSKKNFIIEAARKEKAALWAVIAVNLVLFMAVKYVSILPIPLGFSFYTFQMLSYQIDCYRGTIKRPANFRIFCTYVCMFPQLVAGPIVRYEEIEHSLRRPYVNYENVENGAKLFAYGLGMKVLLGDSLLSLWTSVGMIGHENLICATAWLGAVSLSMQIYFDFCGYSLMAMGLGQMLGYKIPQNFNEPYSAKTISSFWRNWHVTLGKWFKDYLYIPMGGNRKGYFRLVLNLFLVWLFTGVWHGSTLNFIVWAMILFVLIAIEKLGIGKLLEKTKVLGHLYVLLVIPVTWVIFSDVQLGRALLYIQCMFSFRKSVTDESLRQLVRLLLDYKWILTAGVVFCTPIPMRFYVRKHSKWYITGMLFCIFWLSIYEIYMGKNNPFLYFQF